MESLFIVLGALCLFSFIVLLCAIPFLRSHRAQRTLTPIHYDQQNYTITEEQGTGKKKEGKTRKEPIYPIPFGKFTRWAWIQQWYWYHYSRNEETRAAAEDALKLFSHGLGQVFYDWIEQGQPEASEPYIIEASVSEVAPALDQQPETQEQPLPAPGQWNLTSLKAEGYTDIYKIYILGMLSFLYHRLPQSGTIHRDDNKREPGLVMGKVISQSQWDDFIGSSNPNAQKGQGLFRRAELIVDIEREGRKVTVFAHRDVGQAIGVLTQYLIQEQQGQTKQKDEQAPQQRREDEEEKREDTPQPLPQFQWF